MLGVFIPDILPEAGHGDGNGPKWKAWVSTGTRLGNGVLQLADTR